jgi:hypothetical protein
MLYIPWLYEEDQLDKPVKAIGIELDWKPVSRESVGDYQSCFAIEQWQCLVGSEESPVLAVDN